MEKTKKKISGEQAAEQEEERAVIQKRRQPQLRKHCQHLTVSLLPPHVRYEGRLKHSTEQLIRFHIDIQ